MQVFEAPKTPRRIVKHVGLARVTFSAPDGKFAAWSSGGGDRLAVGDLHFGESSYLRSRVESGPRLGDRDDDGLGEGEGALGARGSSRRVYCGWSYG